MTVPDPAAFFSDVVAQNAVAKGLATLLGVPESMITVVVTISGGRRLNLCPTPPCSAPSRLLSGQVTLSYTIEIPPGNVDSTSVENTLTSSSTSDLTTAMQTELTAAKGSGWTVTVDSKTAVTSTVKAYSAPTGSASGALVASTVHGPISFLLFFLIAASLHR